MWHDKETREKGQIRRCRPQSTWLRGRTGCSLILWGKFDLQAHFGGLFDDEVGDLLHLHVGVFVAHLLMEFDNGLPHFPSDFFFRDGSASGHLVEVIKWLEGMMSSQCEVAWHDLTIYSPLPDPKFWPIRVVQESDQSEAFKKSERSTVWLDWANFRHSGYFEINI